MNNMVKQEYEARLKAIAKELRKRFKAGKDEYGNYVIICKKTGNIEDFTKIDYIYFKYNIYLPDDELKKLLKDSKYEL